MAHREPPKPGSRANTREVRNIKRVEAGQPPKKGGC